jgi:hypothetical protein
VTRAYEGFNYQTTNSNRLGKTNRGFEEFRVRKLALFT